jgi:hypothetical protein
VPGISSMANSTFLSGGIPGNSSGNTSGKSYTTLITSDGLIVTEPPKLLGPPTVVLVHRTSDNPAGALDHLTSLVSVFFTLPKSVTPVTQILQHIGGTSMRKQLQ